MIRLAATLIPLALLLSACAPMATQQTPADQSPQTDAAEPTSDREAEPIEEREPETETEEKRPEQPALPEDRSSRDDAEESEPSEPSKAPSREPTRPAEDPDSSNAEAEPAPEASRDTATAERRIDLTGRITMTGGDASPDEAVVYFVPQSADDADRKVDPVDTAEIVTRDKSLSPTVLAVSRGTEVSFPNKDPILHNLFSVSSENSFDVGVYGPDESPSVTFANPGVVNIYCNVHHDMHAHVLVVDTPWRAQAGADGRFRLTGLPAGAGELHVWHRQSERWSRSMKLPTAGTIDVTLEVTKPKLPPHRDKAGQPYNRRDRDPYR